MVVIIYCTVLLFAVIFLIYIRPSEHSTYLSDDIIENIPKEFEELYNKVYNENHEKLENLRIKEKRSILMFAGIWLLTFIILVYGVTIVVDSAMTDHIILKTILAFVIIVAVIFTYYFLKCNYGIKYTFEYKDKVIKKFINLFNNNLEYMQELSNSNYSKMTNFYKDANFTKLIDNNIFALEDNVFGKIDNLYIDFADLRISCENNNKYEPAEKNATAFYGSFCTITLPNKTDNDIRIVSEKFLQIFIDNFLKDGYEYVVMDSDEFESKFNVYAKDKISAMMLLTHDIMEVLVNFREKFFVDFDMIIKENHVYIRFYTEDLFEPTIFKESINKEHLLTQYFILSLIVDLSKILNDILKQ